MSDWSSDVCSSDLERLVPDLDERWPGWQATLLRHARLSAQARDVLDEVAAQDMSGLDCSADGLSFSLQAWRLLAPARQALVLRYWLARQGLRMPTQARLDDIMRQLRSEEHTSELPYIMRIEYAEFCLE